MMDQYTPVRCDGGEEWTWMENTKKIERPIIFSGEMVRAILDGRKTQTRRVVKGDPPCPYGDPGDHLWVKETFCPVYEEDGDRWVDYRATPKYAEPGVSHPAGWENEPDAEDALRWHASIFMPREFSRITLEITGVRVERLQDIKTSDIHREGLPFYADKPGLTPDLGALPSKLSEGPYIKKFADLWDSINADRDYTWESNPWVWVIEFKRIDGKE